MWDLWSLIYTALIGLGAGAAAQYLMPGDDPGNLEDGRGIAITMLIGVIGSFIGRFVGLIIGLSPDHLIGKIIMATIGALILLWGYKKFKEQP